MIRYVLPAVLVAEPLLAHGVHVPVPPAWHGAAHLAAVGVLTVAAGLAVLGGLRRRHGARERHARGSRPFWAGERGRSIGTRQLRRGLGHGFRADVRRRLRGCGVMQAFTGGTARGSATVAVALTALLASCTSTAPPQVPPVRVAEPGEVAGCARIGTMTGVPGLYGVLAAQGIADARRVVMEGAAEQGANTVVFDPIEPGTTVTEVSAATYRC